MGILNEKLMTLLQEFRGIYFQPAYVGAAGGMNISYFAGCRASCFGNCEDSCSGNCEDSCSGSCSDSCDGSCQWGME